MFKNDREVLEYVLAALRKAEEDSYDVQVYVRAYYLGGAINQIENVIKDYLAGKEEDNTNMDGKSVIEQVMHRFIYGTEEGETQ